MRLITLLAWAALLFTGCQRECQLSHAEIGHEARTAIQPEDATEIEQARPAETTQAIAVFEKLGGTVQIDEQNPGRPVRMIDLSSQELTDATLAPLPTFTQLEELYLIETNISDAGLANLNLLAKLRTLDLGRTRITDKGLVHLHELTNLKTLGLSSTRVTEAGVGHLKNLTGLQLLDLSNTTITDAGVQELLEALPHTRILH
jgi:Leucine-rich repeat (LRR) protein